MKTSHTSFRLSGEARARLAKLAKRYGVTRTAVLEILIRGVSVPSRGLSLAALSRRA